MNNYHGNYLGIVIQNNDPEKRGRIKVFVPHISSSVYEKWYQPEDGTVKNKHFKFMGAEGGVETSLTREIIDKLKERVPWAICAAPLVGSQGLGRYNAFLDAGSISDTNDIKSFKPRETPETNTKISEDGIGVAPSRLYETHDFKIKDAFSKTDTEEGNAYPNRINHLAYNYTPSTYSNRSKGSFSIPNVGSHVWIFFQNGDPMMPVYFAASHGKEDWNGIYESETDYPSNFENFGNKDQSDQDLDSNTYRNKFVLNQKAGALEFVNTDNKEILKMSHFSGSFKEFNNLTNIELAIANDQKLVREDAFHTIYGYGNMFIGKDSDFIVRGDHYRKVGNLNKDIHFQWREQVREIALLKQLFEIQRTENIHKAEDTAKTHVPFRKTSPHQIQSGTAAPCPVCSDPQFTDYYWNINNTFQETGLTISNNSQNGARRFETTKYNVMPTKWEKSTVGGSIFGKTCPVCNGSGLSPSSMNGTWKDDPKKGSEFALKLKEVAEKITSLEAQMGKGGSEITNITKHKTETIGMAMNDFGSVRVDSKGKLQRNEVIIHPKGTFNSQKEYPLVEYVHVDDLPGGTYNLNICNKFNVLVGAGGVNLRSYGPVDIGGTIVNVAGEQVNIASQNEVMIDGGKTTTISGDTVVLRQRERKQVLVDSNLGVSQNVVVGGGLYTEGEVFVNHVTAPCEIQETELVRLFGKILKNTKFILKIEKSLSGRVNSKDFGQAVEVGGTAMCELLADSTHDGPHGGIENFPHSHNFKNLPLTLKSSNAAVRRDAMKCNSPKRVEANAIEQVPATSKVK